MAFINWTTPAFYTYILQPTYTPVTVAVPNQVQPTMETNIPEIKEECVSDEETIDNKTNVAVAIKEEPDFEGKKFDFEVTEVQVKKEREDVKPTVEQSTGKNKHFSCPDCSYTTNWKGNLTKHIVSRHTASNEIQWLQCEYCSYKGKTRDYLKCHLLHVHNVSVKWYKCTKCSFKGKLRNHLERHMLLNHTESEQIPWIQCDFCTYKAKFKTNLKQHILSHHTKPSEIHWYHCQYCDFRAKRKRNLKYHEINKHMDDDQIEWFYCGMCTCKFKRKQTLKVHMDVVHGTDSAKGKKNKQKTKEIPVFIENKLCWRRVVVEDDGSTEECVFNCNECNFSSKDKEIFKKHMLKLHTITEIKKEDDHIVKKTYKTKDVLVFVDDVPCVKKVIEHSLSQSDI